MYADLGHLVIMTNHLADRSRCKRLPEKYFTDAKYWCHAHHVTTGKGGGNYDFSTDVKKYTDQPEQWRRFYE
jgi:hypothetical protein